MATAVGATLTGNVLGALLRAVSTKLLAVGIGPSYLALFMGLQQVAQTAVVVGSLNGQTAIVQGLASLRGPARREFATTAITLIGIATSLVNIVLIAANERIALALGWPENTRHVFVFLVVPVTLSIALVVLSAVLNVLGSTTVLACFPVLGAGANLLMLWPVVALVRAGHPLMLVLLQSSSVVACLLLALWHLRRHLGDQSWLTEPTTRWNPIQARTFFSISTALLVSGACASVALLLVKMVITETEGLKIAGLFDAAWFISMNHVLVVTSALRAYCLPAFSEIDRAIQYKRLESVILLTLLADVPLLVIFVMTKPLLLSALFSARFLDASIFLRWFLPFDYLRITAWILSVSMLGNNRIVAFLLTDLLAPLLFAFGALGLTAGLPMDIAAVSFGAGSLANFIACVRHHWRAGFRPTRATSIAWTLGLFTVSGASVHAWSDTTVDWPKMGVWTLLTLAWAVIYFVRHLRSNHLLPRQGAP